MVQVIYGANEIHLPVERYSVSLVLNAIQQILNFSSDCVAFLNGDRIEDPTTSLQNGDRLELMKERGCKGAFKIVNGYGNVDLTKTKLSKRYEHVSGKRLQPLCRRLKIEFAEAVVGFRGHDRYGYKPVKDGVVVSARVAPRLRAAIQERQRKARKRRKVVRPKPSVLSALWTLNRRAKRCRDLAQTYYQAGMYGFAGKMRREKEGIYELKEQALHYLVEEGLLAHSGYHQFSDENWTEVLDGDGFSFHRPCPEPIAPSQADIQLTMIEAKPKGAGEPTLDMSRNVVSEYLQDKPRVAVYSWPYVPRFGQEHWNDEFDEWDDEFDFDDEEYDHD